MAQETIVLNGTDYTFQQIINNEVWPASEFEKSTIAFMRSWLLGEKSFPQETSGSTGKPKIVTITRDQMTASAKMTERALRLQRDHTALVCLDTKYIAGKMMLARCFITGMTIIALEPSANPLEKLLDNQSFDFAAFVPYQLQTIVNSNPHKLDQVKLAIVGGGKVSSDLTNKLQNSTCTLFETFGMTETISHVALRRINGGRTEAHMFTALPDVVLKLDARGCLVVDAPFLENPVHTNDLVELVDPSHFRWLGRWDNVINTGGSKVIPEEVEAVLKKIFDEMSLPHRFFVAGIADEMLGHKVCLVIEGNEMASTVVQMLADKIRQRVSRFEVPKEILFVKKFVETQTGKINRNETINLFPANSN